jgi:DNA-binding transcriptional MerR regulator
MRKLPTPVVANKLGVSTYTVRKMVEKGILTDLGVTQRGKVKHEYKFDSKEIKEFLASHVRDGRKWVKVASAEQKPKRTYARRQQVDSIDRQILNLKPTKSTVKTGSNGDGPAGFSTRLANIEKTLNRLAKIWE